MRKAPACALLPCTRLRSRVLAGDSSRSIPFVLFRISFPFDTSGRECTNSIATRCSLLVQPLVQEIRPKHTLPSCLRTARLKEAVMDTLHERKLRAIVVSARLFACGGQAVSPATHQA